MGNERAKAHHYEAPTKSEIINGNAVVAESEARQAGDRKAELLQHELVERAQALERLTQSAHGKTTNAG